LVHGCHAFQVSRAFYSCIYMVIPAATYALMVVNTVENAIMFIKVWAEVRSGNLTLIIVQCCGSVDMLPGYSLKESWPIYCR